MQTALRLLAAIGAAMAPALAAQLLLVQAARSQTAAPAYPSLAVYDRYGAGARGPWSSSASPQAVAAGPRLSWSGKSDPPTPSPIVAAAGGPAPWRFTPPIGANPEPAPVAAGPTSIYDPPPPMRGPAPQTAQDEQAGSARRYSVHRDYGVEPDPIPLPPQFFGATADLSQPATAEPIRKTATANGKAVNPLQPADGQ